MTSARRARLDRLGDQAAVDRFGRPSRDLVLRPDAALGDAHALGIVDLEAAARFLLEAFQHADDMARNVAVAADRGVAGVGADHRHPAGSRDASSGSTLPSFWSSTIARPAASRASATASGVAVSRVGRGRVDIGVLEQAGIELHAQDAAHGVVDLRLGHPALADERGQE